MAKLPTYTPGTFYVSNGVGEKICGGNDFPTLAEGVKAATSAAKRSASSARNHGGGNSFDVREAIPGNHVTRAIVTPDLQVIYQ